MSDEENSNSASEQKIAQKVILTGHRYEVSPLLQIYVHYNKYMSIITNIRPL